MGRILLFVGAFIVVAAGVAYVFREQIFEALMPRIFVPASTFSESAAPPAPDYTDPGSWAALPETEDGADLIPPDTEDVQAAAPVDVFFIHPTTYLKRESWNGPIDDPAAKEYVDDFVMPSQASVFNVAARIYAPRYRQATFGAYFKPGGDADAAFELAYGDLDRAFDHFLSLTGERPFFVAGHSQGAMHMRKLLRDRIAGTPLAKRLVAAYPIGFDFNVGALKTEWPDIPICENPTQTTCYVAWNTYGPKGKPWVEDADNPCVNPLTWSTDGAYAGFDKNKGAASSRTGLAPIPGAADAQCIDGMLRVTDIRTNAFDKLPSTGKDNYHLLDYNLFYFNMRENAVARADAFMSAGAAAAAVN